MDFIEAAAWEAWLADHHETQSEAWLRIGKRNSNAALITIAEAGDVALCFGWIDGLRKACDAESFLQRYSRRRPRSPWSKINVARAESLIAAGRMRPAAIKEVDDAKADGRWSAAYESQRTADVPSELAAALADHPPARTAFERLGRTERYALILPLLKAHTPVTHAKALAGILTQLDKQA
ncbi:YdeI/OmpD-associated family protein [Arthrobacter sp. 35W]|uniref:YdeI/OmpD-associated family protein n=1 Tax=Arthrobacter sp. 35W TaxID=1132441 RepID=UPI00055162CD|nr:YdeI/OmpD-associated family protein [Arthrobacter sp. 35W]